MANVKEQNASLKARQTKLLKKTKDELIEVILRKDKVERNQVNQISKLKGEINSLQSRIKGFEADNEGNEKTIKELREYYSKLEHANETLRENIDSKSIELAELTDKFNKTIVEKEEKIKSWANIAISTAIVLGIAFISAALAYVMK